MTEENEHGEKSCEMIGGISYVITIGLKKIYLVAYGVFVSCSSHNHVSILNDMEFALYLDSLLIDPS